MQAQRTPLPTLEAKSEAQYEGWADAVAGHVRNGTHHTDEGELIAVIKGKLPMKARAQVMRLSAAESKDVEHFLSVLAKGLFRESDYVDLYFADLLKYSEEDLPEIVHVLRGKLDRYVRLAHRWGVAQPVTRRLIERNILFVCTSLREIGLQEDDRRK